MTIGETLRAAREAKGFSVQDVVTATRMTARQVTDMEADDFSSFAYPFYAKVFLRQFARAVGLDPAPIVARWAAESGSLEPSSGHAPIVPLETIDEESGGLRVVKPEVPSESKISSGEAVRSDRRSDRPEKRVAPLPEPPPKEDSPRPEKRAAASDPLIAAAAATQADVFASPLSAPSAPARPLPAAGAAAADSGAPLPVKRVAEVHPGDVAPEPISLRAPEAAVAREIRPVRDLPPVVKKLPVDPEEDPVPVSSSVPATVPDFIETSTPAFVFPGAAPVPAPESDAIPAPVPEAPVAPPAPSAPVPEVPVAPPPPPAPVPKAPVAPPPPSPPVPEAPVAPPPPSPPEADLPLFSLQSEPAPSPVRAVPSVASVPVAPSLPSPPVAPVEEDDSPFGNRPARRTPLTSLVGLASSVASVFRRRKPTGGMGEPFGGADLLSDIDSPPRRFPLPSRPVALAGGAVVVVLAIAGLLFSGPGDSGPTPPPVDSDIEEEESLSPSPVLSPAPAQADPSVPVAPAPAPVPEPTQASVPAPTQAPAPAPTAAVPSVPSVPSVPVAPAPPAQPTPLLPPPRLFAR